MVPDSRENANGLVTDGYRVIRGEQGARQQSTFKGLKPLACSATGKISCFLPLPSNLLTPLP